MWRKDGADLASSRVPGRSDVQVRHLQGVRLDEIAPRFDDIAHQGREDILGLVAMGNLDLEQHPGAGIRVVSQSWSGFISPSPL